MNDEQQALIDIAHRLKSKQALFFSDIKDVHRLAEAYLANHSGIRFPEKHQLIRNDNGVLSVVDCYLCEDFEQRKIPETCTE